MRVDDIFIAVESGSTGVCSGENVQPQDPGHRARAQVFCFEGRKLERQPPKTFTYLTSTGVP